MFNIIIFIENLLKFIKIKIKIFYWKLKYGKRIKIGKKFRFRKGLIINISKNGYLEIGDNCFFNNYCSINCHTKIIIGKNNLFGENVKIYDHNHIFNNKNIDMEISFSEGEVVIGTRNWFGTDCVILNNTHIGNDNVFQANVTINQKFLSGYIIRNLKDYNIEKINFK